MDRKYRQRGYREDEREDKPKGAPRPKGAAWERAPKTVGVREVSRCSACGEAIPMQFGLNFDSQCPKCKTDLRTCKNCVHFDTARQFECNKPIPERISPKDRRNQCSFFEIRKAVERETSTAVSKMEDPRKAFDRLFRK
ncbi:MAG: hypothetical protein HY650_10165 [Acidobacteria bacterium]|nr:hypothetical protein [Acidobacteriota bacterium]